MARVKVYHYVKYYTDSFTLCGLHTDRYLHPAAHHTTCLAGLVDCKHCRRLLGVTDEPMHPAASSRPKGVILDVRTKADY